MQSDDWFSVDRKGLANLLGDRKPRLVLELLQNCWDADGASEVKVTLTDGAGRGRSLLSVEDDAPDGFARLSDAYTFYARSTKIDDPTKRGRFNEGEKMFLALCVSATITSTTGAIDFTEKGRVRRKTRLAKGSRIDAFVRLTKAEREEALVWLSRVIPPEGITTTVNGVALVPRTPVRVFPATLPTVIPDAEGVLRTTRRRTTVRLYEPAPGETPYLYEGGLPVVEHEGRWHIDIAQRIPLNRDRDGVTPAYLREVRVAVLNETHDLLTKEDASSGWVKEATSDDRASDEAVRETFTKQWGEGAVIYDPSDPDSNAEAMLQGRAVVPGGALSREQWRQVKRSEAALPAGQVTPSNSSVETDPDGVPPLDVADWTPGMHRLADYARLLSKELLGFEVAVSVYRVVNGKAAWFTHGGRSLSFNLQVLGHRWFDQPSQRDVDALLLHEFSHHRVGDHMSERFHSECCRLGALLRDSSARL
jgi:hypothetical protein